MAQMKKKKKEVGAISTASLPDIVFMLLFFFMVTTVMREVELKVSIKTPNATELQKLERKDLVTYIYVGKPNTTYAPLVGTEPRIQLNDSFARIEDIQPFAIQEREKINEKERNALTVSIKADRDVKMGLMGDIKQELRRAQSYKVSYSAIPGEVFIP
jgi:biopolymer transport protein ExbD